MAAKSYPGVLLVEGDEDKRVIPQLMGANGTRWGERDQPKIVHIEAFGEIEAMLEPGEIETQLKASGLLALGILVDADGDAGRRWAQLLPHFTSHFTDLPTSVPEAGLVATSPDGVRLGVWLMPDNRSPGMMETFLACLRPEANGPLLAYVDEVWTTARGSGRPARTLRRPIGARAPTEGRRSEFLRRSAPPLDPRSRWLGGHS